MGEGSQVKVLAMVVSALAMASIVTPPSAAKDAPTVGILCHCRSDLPMLQAFEAELGELGWRSDGKVQLVRRTSDGDPARLARDAEEMVRLNPDVIFAGFTPAVVAVQRHTAKIPVVFAGVSDPIEIGAASQIARPDRNFTGVTTMNRELMPKRLELVKEALPGLSKVGYLANPLYALHQPQLEEMQGAAGRLGLTLITVEARTPADIDRAFAELASQRVQALVVQQDPLFTGQTKRVVALAQTHRLPAMYPLRSYFDAGGMMWYGADIVGQFRRAAIYVDKILKGTLPGSIPIERPAKLTLTVNLKVAKELGITISSVFLIHADEVIE
jgi:putative ABC transport system substrate-binding protein